MTDRRRIRKTRQAIVNTSLNIALPLSKSFFTGKLFDAIMALVGFAVPQTSVSGLHLNRPSVHYRYNRCRHADFFC